jgi:hypothetical protein
MGTILAHGHGPDHGHSRTMTAGLGIDRHLRLGARPIADLIGFPRSITFSGYAGRRGRRVCGEERIAARE